MREIEEFSPLLVQRENGESLGSIFFALPDSYQQLSYKEKCQFVLVALLYCDLSGSAWVNLERLIYKDSDRIAMDLSKIPNSVLKDRLGLNSRTIKDYRAYLKALKKLKRTRELPGQPRLAMNRLNY